MTKSDSNTCPMGESQAIMSELMMPNMANNFGNVFGGVILSLVDRVGAVAATRHARLPCVTVSIDRVDFLEPIHLGELVTARANVNFVGRTSMEVGVRIDAENLITGELRHTNSCYVIYVGLGEKGRPVPVPGVTPESDVEERWFEGGKVRRARRMEERIIEDGE